MGALSCLRPLDDHVTVHVGVGGTTHVRSVMRCGSVWSCPWCAPVVRSQKAEEITAAVESWLAKGGRVWFVTGTIPHTATDSLDVLLNRLQEMWTRAYGAGSGGQGVRRRNGVVGSVRSIEVTRGDNGWHPHIHALVFVEPGVPFSVADWTARWRAQFSREGFDYVPGVSMDVRQVRTPDTAEGATAIGQYVAAVEGGWGAGLEIARADLKGRGGLRADQILELASTGEKRWVWRWREYEQATKGRRCIVWSRGLRALCGLDEVEATDEELAAGPDADEVIGLVIVPAAEWNSARSSGQLGELLEAVVRGDRSRWRFHTVGVDWSGTRPRWLDPPPEPAQDAPLPLVA